MAKAKKVKGAMVGKPPTIVRTRVAILDGTGPKDIYMAKYTVYNLPPTEVMQAIKILLDNMAAAYEKSQKG